MAPAIGLSILTYIGLPKIYRTKQQKKEQKFRRATLGIANLLSSLDEDRPTILRKLNTIESKVDQILGSSARTVKKFHRLWTFLVLHRYLDEKSY